MNHLKINKPIFLKKVRVYNDLFKKEETKIISITPPAKKNIVPIKSSFFGKVLDLSSYTCLNTEGGKFFFTKDPAMNPVGFFLSSGKFYFLEHTSGTKPHLSTFWAGRSLLAQVSTTQNHWHSFLRNLVRLKFNMNMQK